MHIRTAFLVSLLLACAPDSTVAPEEVTSQRAQWRAQAPRHYQVDEDVSCFCPPPHQVQIEVQDDVIVGMTDRASGDSVPPASWSRFYTIEGLFDLIAAAYPQNPARIEVTFHNTEHYPTSINLDYRAIVADDELFISAASLTPLP